MTLPPSKDPLVALWQTAPKPDTQHLLQDLQRVNLLHRRTSRSVLAILWGLAALFLFEEATGRVGSHGLLTVIWIAVILGGRARQRRARCSRSDALSLDTVNLLKFMIARAKRDLRTARSLYAGVPLGAAAGAVLAKLAGIGGSPSVHALHPRIQMVQTGAGVATLVAMTVTGAILARARSAEVRQLSEKLKSAEAGL